MAADRLRIDIETRCALDLRTSSVYAYAAHPTFRVLMASWSLNGGPVTDVVGQDEVLHEVPGLWDPDVVKVAHNAQFERVCFSSARLGPGRFLPPAQWHDTLAVAAERGYPGKLGDLAKWLGGQQKDEAGTRLINLFCKPRRDGGWNGPHTHPEQWVEFVDYCHQDVVTLVDVDERLGDFPTVRERDAWIADQEINDRGVRVDVELALAAVDAVEDNAWRAELEITSLTGVENPNSREQLFSWVRRSGLPLPDLRAETIEAALTDPTLTPVQHRVLTLRAELALAAAKKYTAALDGVSADGRLRGQFRFFGAHTGRWAGRGVQLHNLPRDQFTRADPETGKKVWDDVAERGAVLDLKLGNGADAATLKRLVRAQLVGPFTVVDYAAIEARVVAWLAGEDWALRAFAERRDIYVETANRMSTPSHPLTRQQGKVAVLALGYNGGVHALRVMGADGTDETLQRLVTQWRAANPAIVELWGNMGDAFRRGGSVGDHVQVEVDGLTRHVRLPSGRAITYHGCLWNWEDTARGRRRVASFRDPKRGGARQRTYGGRLIENVTQAVARDVLADALVRLTANRLPVVGHVHDEVLVEGARLEEVTALMTQAPDWAPGLPIDAEGFVTERYRKG